MKRNRITFKIFYITTLLLVASALIIYLTLYFLLPSYYYNHKEATLHEGVNTLIEKIEPLTFTEAEPLLGDFVHEYNVHLIIQNRAGFIIYFPTNMDQKLNGEMNRGRNHVPFRQQVNRRFIEEELTRSEVISISELVKFKNDLQQYQINVVAPLQPIDEASKVILMFLPYMTIAIIIISIIGAYLYSNIISKPLLKLNRTAKQMAQLDFSSKSEIASNDELGELSSNLNKLAKNLKINMDELQEANDQLKDDIQKEREQEEKRREFMATVSHELKTPITAVSGQLEGMIHQIGAYKDRDKYLQQSYEIMKDMERLVYEILDVSQLESFDFSPQIKTINLSNLLEKTVGNFLYFRDLKMLEFVTEIERELYIEADEKLMTKAIANVISNAVKYSGEGEKVFISLKKRDNVSELRVLNTGAHIDEKELQKIFQPFYRVEKSRNRKTGGSGLGLYIVKKILDIHQAEYSVTNDQKGVLFLIKF